MEGRLRGFIIDRYPRISKRLPPDPTVFPAHLRTGPTSVADSRAGRPIAPKGETGARPPGRASPSWYDDSCSPAGPSPLR